jgi:hypothetical protein
MIISQNKKERRIFKLRHSGSLAEDMNLKPSGSRFNIYRGMILANRISIFISKLIYYDFIIVIGQLNKLNIDVWVSS